MPYKNPNSEDARASQRLRKKRYNEAHREKVLSDMRELGRRKRKERNQYAAQHREEIRASVKKYRLAHPEIHRAHKAIVYAIRIGKLIRPLTCSNCGNGGRIQAHHHQGYAPERKLDVIWLCHPCHKLEHRASAH